MIKKDSLFVKKKTPGAGIVFRSGQESEAIQFFCSASGKPVRASRIAMARQEELGRPDVCRVAGREPFDSTEICRPFLIERFPLSEGFYIAAKTDPDTDSDPPGRSGESLCPGGIWLISSSPAASSQTENTIFHPFSSVFVS